MLRTLGLAMIAAAACTDDVPTAPRFQEDVMPILAANCVRCHAVPQIGGAPGACVVGVGPTWCGFRLDSYDDTILDSGDPANPDDDRGVRGAASIALAIPLRVNSTDQPMPPRFPLGDDERAILTAWSRGDPHDRTPRPDNAPPTATATVTATATTVTVRYVVADADRDLVVGTIVARDARGDRVIAAVTSGTDTTTGRRPPPGTYAVVARLDDGAGVREVPLGALEVAP